MCLQFLPVDHSAISGPPLWSQHPLQDLPEYLALQPELAKPVVMTRVTAAKNGRGKHEADLSSEYKPAERLGPIESVPVYYSARREILFAPKLWISRFCNRIAFARAFCPIWVGAPTKRGGRRKASFDGLRRTAAIQVFADHMEMGVASLRRREDGFGRGESVGGPHQSRHGGNCRVRVGGECLVALDDKVVGI